MKANELRIGNLTFEFNQNDNEWIESNVSCWDFEKARLNNNETEFEHRKHIPITEEWLLKFGFEEESDTEGDIYMVKQPLWIYENERIYYSKSRDDYFFYLKNIFYVHQLQNLYFALTGKELEIK